jgi:hypothetical protein
MPAKNSIGLQRRINKRSFYYIMNEFGIEDLVYYKQDGIIKSMGYKIDNERLQQEAPALKTGGQAGGGQALRALTVPAGLFTLRRTAEQTSNKPEVDTTESGVISTSLYDKLLGLVGRRRSVGTRRTRRKRKKQPSRGTRKR